MGEMSILKQFEKIFDVVRASRELIDKATFCEDTGQMLVSIHLGIHLQETLAAMDSDHDRQSPEESK